MQSKSKKSKSKKKIAINLLMFKIIWLVCVFSAVHEVPWLSVFALIILLLVHFRWIDQLSGILTILIVSVLGSAFDQLMLYRSYISYQATGWEPSLVPVWIISLWSAFATTLNTSFKFLENNLFLASLIGLISGPLAFLSAEKLGAVKLEGLMTVAYLALGWGVLLPIMMLVNRRISAKSHKF